MHTIVPHFESPLKTGLHFSLGYPFSVQSGLVIEINSDLNK